MRIARISVIACLACALEGRTLTVGGGGEFHDVRSALAAANSGDTIEVRGGTYQGNLMLDKAVVLEGIGEPVLRGDGTGSVITTTAPGSTIRGFRVEHSGTMLVHEDSGILLKSDGNRIENNKLRDVLFGIYLFQSNHNMIAGNTIEGRRELGYGERGAGVHAFNCFENTIDRNWISVMRDGMYLQNLDRSTIRGNHISDLRYGLHYMYSNDNVFEDNVFEDNIAGAAIMYSRNIQFRRNAFLHNRGFSSFGILFQDSTHLVSEQNLVVDNAVGIFMEALTDSRFERNLIAANDTAIEVFSSSDGNDFTRNNFVSNLSPIRVIGRNSNIRFDRNGIGNYWSNYGGYDLDGDGVGDVGFRIQNLFEHLEGNRPRLRIYLDSPAAQALAAAEEAFPIIGGSREFDHYPLMKPVDLQVSLPMPRGHHSAPGLLAYVALSMTALGSTLMWRGSK
jgi:nitrous oxidase accessory protein